MEGVRFFIDVFVFVWKYVGGIGIMFWIVYFWWFNNSFIFFCVVWGWLLICFKFDDLLEIRVKIWIRFSCEVIRCGEGDERVC